MNIWTLDYWLEKLLTGLLVLVVLFVLGVVLAVPFVIAEGRRTNEVATRAMMKMHPELTHDEAYSLVITHSER